LQAWDRRTWLVAIPLVLIVIAAFIPAVDNGFVSWDDDYNFLENPFFRGLGLAQAKWAWSTLWAGVYQPLAWLLFGAQYVFWKLDPRGYHLTSLFFHAANTVVLYVLTVTLLVRCQPDSFLKSPWTCALGAGLATALFAVHPLRVEAVAWASCQPYMPCALLSMLAVLAYLRAFPMDSSPRWGWLVCSFVLFVVALLFKAVAMTLPAVLLILDVYPLRRFGDGPGRWFGSAARKLLLEKVPFLLVSIVFMGLAVAAKPQSQFPIEHQNVFASIVQVCCGIWFYIVKTALPLDLIPIYPMPREINVLALRFLFSILGTLAMTVGSFLLRRRWPGLLAAWLSYLVILAPNSGLIRFSNQIAADRYSYMAMLGLVVLAAAGLCWSWQMSLRARPGAILMIALSLGALPGLVLLTWHQCRIWRTSETLWTYALNHGAGRSAEAHNGLGTDLVRQGKFAEAAAHYDEAIRLDPHHANAFNNLGLLRFDEGKLAEAAAHYSEAIRLDPHHVNAFNNLGLVLARQGKVAEMAAHSSEAVRLNPGSAGAHNNLGTVLARQGKSAEAAAHYNEAIRLNPGSAEAHNNLGTVLVRQGKFAEAAAHYNEAIRLNPANADALNNLGKLCFDQGNFAEAAAHYDEVARLNPGSAGAHNRLGMVLARQGNFAEAAAHYDQAIRLNPDDAGSLNNCAMMWAACPEAKYRDGKRAVEAATHACKLAGWKQPDFLDTLSAAYAETGDFDAAVRWQSKAIEFLVHEREKEKGDYRSRLLLYQAKKPYRETSPGRFPTEAHP
jgi:protein O-mannosyl-transferase